MNSAPLLLATRGSVAEVFRSWQGEGLLLGRRMVFVRLAGCRVGCRYCDTAWAFDAPASVAVPGRGSSTPGAGAATPGAGAALPGAGAAATGTRPVPGAALPTPPAARRENPLDVATVLELVAAADPQPAPGGRAPVTLTGGEPCEQTDFAAALIDALLADPARDVMLETSALHREALARLAPGCRWIAADIKLPSATGLPDVLARHAEVLAAGVLPPGKTFFKLVADGDTTDAEVAAAAALLARHAAAAPVFLQPVTPLGGSPPLPRARLDALADILLAAGLDVRVVPQVHKVLGVR
jgi:7-carboxy-7-deazaguanine synthase